MTISLVKTRTHVFHGHLSDSLRMLSNVLEEIFQVRHRRVLDVAAQTRNRLAHRLTEPEATDSGQVDVFQLLQRLQRWVVPGMHDKQFQNIKKL